MWPEELTRWVNDLYHDNQVLAAITRSARYAREPVEEAIQRAMPSALQVYERLMGKERTYATFRAIMCCVARRRMFDELSTLQRWRSLPVEETLSSREGDELTRERARVFREVLAELPADEQRLLNLRVEGYTFAEIGERETVSAGTIYRRLQGPLKHLRQRLWELAAELFSDDMRPGTC